MKTEHAPIAGRRFTLISHTPAPQPSCARDIHREPESWRNRPGRRLRYPLAAEWLPTLPAA